jgi:Sigma-70 factor, region 1.2/Sigma-70 region 3
LVSGDDGWGLPAAQVAVGGATADPVKDYLKQIGKVPLLNAGQEVELAKRIEAAVFADHKLAEGSGVLRPGQSSDLERVTEDGRRAKNHLVEANLRLVVSLARRCAGRGMLLLDLIQEGNLGLIRAAEGAHPRGTRGRARHDPEKVIEVQKYGREPISLHTPLGDDGDSEFGDLIEDSEAIQPGEAVSFTLLHEQLHSVLSTLPERAALTPASPPLTRGLWRAGNRAGRGSPRPRPRRLARLHPVVPQRCPGMRTSWRHTGDEPFPAGADVYGEGGQALGAGVTADVDQGVQVGMPAVHAVGDLDRADRPREGDVLLQGDPVPASTGHPGRSRHGPVAVEAKTPRPEVCLRGRRADASNPR